MELGLLERIAKSLLILHFLVLGKQGVDLLWTAQVAECVLRTLCSRLAELHLLWLEKSLWVEDFEFKRLLGSFVHALG